MAAPIKPAWGCNPPGLPTKRINAYRSAVARNVGKQRFRLTLHDEIITTSLFGGPYIPVPGGYLTAPLTSPSRRFIDERYVIRQPGETIQES